jgi:hypothetical protein
MQPYPRVHMPPCPCIFAIRMFTHVHAHNPHDPPPLPYEVFNLRQLKVKLVFFSTELC